MIPYRTSHLGGLSIRVREQTDEVSSLLGEGDDAYTRWRPDERRWSLAGHVAHMAIVNGPYLDAMNGALDDAHEAGGPKGDGPWKHSVVARWFVRQNEPPPKRRLKTFKAMVPDPGTSAQAALTDFASAQGRLLETIDRAEGWDLGRVRFRSPFFALLRLSVGTGLGLLVAHNDRHIWLMHEVNRMRSEG